MMADLGRLLAGRNDATGPGSATGGAGSPPSVKGTASSGPQPGGSPVGDDGAPSFGGLLDRMKLAARDEAGTGRGATPGRLPAPRRAPDDPVAAPPPDPLRRLEPAAASMPKPLWAVADPSGDDAAEGADTSKPRTAEDGSGSPVDIAALAQAVLGLPPPLQPADPAADAALPGPAVPVASGARAASPAAAPQLDASPPLPSLPAPSPATSGGSAPPDVAPVPAASPSRPGAAVAGPAPADAGPGDGSSLRPAAPSSPGALPAGPVTAPSTTSSAAAPPVAAPLPAPTPSRGGAAVAGPASRVPGADDASPSQLPASAIPGARPDTPTAAPATPGPLRANPPRTMTPGGTANGAPPTPVATTLTPVAGVMPASSPAGDPSDAGTGRAAATPLDPAGPGGAPAGLAPLPASPALQDVLTGLAALIASSAPAPDPLPAAANAGVPAAPSAPPDPATPGQVRTTPDGGREIVVKLDPEHLGSVSIRLKMTAGKVDVAIRVSEPSTLHLLDQDRHVLAAAVSSAGLGRDALTLAAVTPDRAPGQPLSAGPGDRRHDPERGGDGGASASGDPSGERRRDDRRSVSPGRPGPAEIRDPAAAARAGAIYV